MAFDRLIVKIILDLFVLACGKYSFFLLKNILQLFKESNTLAESAISFDVSTKYIAGFVWIFIFYLFLNLSMNS